MGNNSINISKVQEEDFILQKGDIIVLRNVDILVVTQMSMDAYNLITLNDDFNRWNDKKYTLEELTAYVKSYFVPNEITIHRKSIINIDLGKKIN